MGVANDRCFPASLRQRGVSNDLNIVTQDLADTILMVRFDSYTNDRNEIVAECNLSIIIMISTT